MTQNVSIPGVGNIQFPDGMSQADMTAAIQKNFPQIHNPAQTKQAGYQDSQTGAFMPMADAGKVADAPSGSGALGATNGALDVGSSAISAIPSGLAGIGGALKAAGANALNALGAPVDPENVGDTAQGWMQNTQDFLNKPRLTIGSPDGSNTRGAEQAVTGAASDVFGAIPKGLDALYTMKQDAIRNSPLGKLPENQDMLGANAEARNRLGLDLFSNIGQLAPGLRGVPEADAAEGVPLAAPTPQSAALAKAQQIGIPVTPSYVKGSPIGSGLEDLTSSAMLERDASRKAAPAVNQYVGQDIGIPGVKSYTPQVIKQAKAGPNAVYEQARSIGMVPTDDVYAQGMQDIGRYQSDGTIPQAVNDKIQALKDRLDLHQFTGNDAISEIGSLRSQGRKNLRSPDADTQNYGSAQMDAAHVMEDQLDRFVSSPNSGFSPDMIKNWQAARVQLAKINDVQRSLVGTDVSAAKLAKLADRADAMGKPGLFTGNMRDVADVYRQFPNVLKDASKLKGPKNFSKWDATFGGGGIATALLAGHPEVALGIGAYMAGQPLIRQGLLSGPYQAMLGKSLSMNPVAMAPLLKGIAIPALTAGNQQPLPPWLLPNSKQ